ncbi:hypothetical protein [Vibrio cionasavignyae]|uniref:hypothetical protein n=1 Tax=Vibrio cionasavignyae TaxID=2910252 RepID=UPI003D13D712
MIIRGGINGDEILSGCGQYEVRYEGFKYLSRSLSMEALVSLQIEQNQTNLILLVTVLFAFLQGLLAFAAGSVFPQNSLHCL